MGKPVLTASWSFWANENFLGNCKSRQSYPHSIGLHSKPIYTDHHFSVPFLGYDGKYNVAIQPCDLLSTLVSTKIREETLLCAVLCPEAFKLSLNLILLFFFFNLNSSLLVTSSFAFSKLLPFPEVGVELNTYSSTSSYYFTHTITLLAWEGGPVARETRRTA